MAAPSIPVSTREHGTAVNPAARRQACALAFRWISGFVGLGLIAHLTVMLWAQHDFTPVEALVALQGNMFAHGQGLYWGVNRYPYTISAYGPILYAISGLLQKWGLPAYQSGRMVSFAALLTALWLCWQALGYLTKNKFARAAAVILAASTANILFWGTTGQTDMLGATFALAAFTAFLKFREQRDLRALALAGVMVVLAVFTKQTFLAAGAAIGLTLLWDGRKRGEDRKRAIWWISGVAAAGVAIAFGLNTATHGGYFEDAILANFGPFALVFFKLRQHVEYLLLTGSGVIVAALAGVRRISRRTAPLYLYAALATAVWLLTAPKIGSDLNYQIEMMLVFAICAGVALDRLDFFDSIFTGRRSWVTLLQMPLVLHLAVNLLLTGRGVAERALEEPAKARETAALQPFVSRPGKLFLGQYDPLVQYRGSIDIEPYIYCLLVKAGITKPEPVLLDLATRRFSTIILDEDLFNDRPVERDPELATLPASLAEAIRQNYRIVKHLDGPNNPYIYEPRRD
jgi:hypothetical protein